ncbi:MAG: amidophosphoribosyltransferase [Cardiobacteriales bacterium]|nr:MAG: amidophosphoribosyltransferase [Cardiobacteriales bacterium]
MVIKSFALFGQRLASWLDQCCVCCQQPSSGLLCPACDALLEPIGGHCRCCAREVGGANITCGACLRRPSAVDRVYLAYRYRTPLRELVLKAKYGRDRGALEVLKQLVLHAWDDEIACGVIVPMPMAKRRLAERGFNQTHFLAQALANYAQLPMAKTLLTKITRPPQSLLKTDAERRRNIKGAFFATVAVEGHVILVDDVVTSGATAQEAAKVLKEAGATLVSLVAIAAR